MALADLGYPITLITGRAFEKEILGLHPKIKFLPLHGDGNWMTEELAGKLAKLPPWSEESELLMQQTAFVDTMQPMHETVQKVFRDFRAEYGDKKPLISLYDGAATGHMPVLLGAPGIRADSSLAIALHPLTLDSNDTYPSHVDKLPEIGPDAKLIHWKASQQERVQHYRTREMDIYWTAKLREMGVKQDPLPTFFHALGSLSDHLMNLGIPEFEFPRSDLRANVHFFGALRSTKKSDCAEVELPDWWNDIAEAKQEGKKIVAVSQGTVQTNLQDLLIPTLEAVKSRNDVLVIATTVVVEPEDVPDFVLPANARVAKFIPYDHLLPFVSSIEVIHRTCPYPRSRLTF